VEPKSGTSTPASTDAKPADILTLSESPQPLRSCADTLAGLTCDVCQRKPVIGVASSSLGPISLAYCRECANKPAEPLWLFEFTYEQCGTEVREDIKSMFAWMGDEYISWDEFVKTKTE